MKNPARAKAWPEKLKLVSVHNIAAHKQPDSNLNTAGLQADSRQTHADSRQIAGKQQHYSSKIAVHSNINRYFSKVKQGNSKHI